MREGEEEGAGNGIEGGERREERGENAVGMSKGCEKELDAHFLSIQ